MNAAAKLQVQGISKVFRSQDRTVVALEDVSFEVGNGELAAIIGPSGCGKTTLLRIIQGLIPADRGTVLVDGKPVSGPGYDRGMVFQQAGLFPWRNVLHNVAFGLELRKVPLEQRLATARRYIDLVGLQGFEEAYPHQLSGGMRQRVGLARAMAIEPAILLMDEPFGALDAQTRENLQDELLQIRGRTGMTILLITHDLDEAVCLADKVIVLSARPGKVLETIEVGLDRTGKSVADLKADPVFVRQRRRLHDLIRLGAGAAAS